MDNKQALYRDSFITDSVIRGGLQPLAAYSVRSHASAGSGNGSSSNNGGTRRGRSVFSDRDKARMLLFAEQHAGAEYTTAQGRHRTYTAKGPALWKAAEQQSVAAHSWQAMLAHFKSTLCRLTVQEKNGGSEGCQPGCSEETVEEVKYCALPGACVISSTAVGVAAMIL